MDHDRLGLSALIEHVRREIEQAKKAGSGEAVRFRLDKVVLDVAFTFAEGNTESGGGDIRIFALRGENTRSAESLNRVTLTMTIADDADDENGTDEEEPPDLLGRRVRNG